MNKRVFFIWSICLLAIVPLLAGCDKDDEEDLIVVESFAGTDGMEGERIVMELEDVPAVIVGKDSLGEYVIVGIGETLSFINDIPTLIGVPKKEWGTHDFPLQTKVRVSLSVTNVVQYEVSNLYTIDRPLVAIRKTYLREIKTMD